MEGGAGLVFLHQWHFDSLDLRYMRRLLDDAAGGPGNTVLGLSQVGQGHGGVDLPPVGLVSALRLLLPGRSLAEAAGAAGRGERRQCLQRKKNRKATFQVNLPRKGQLARRSSL